MSQALDPRNRSDARNQALQVLVRLAPWKSILGPAGYQQLDDERWEGPNGDVVLVEIDGGLASAGVDPPAAGHWADLGTSCRSAFTKLFHDGDQAAAAADLLAAASRSPLASGVARGLP